MRKKIKTILAVILVIIVIVFIGLWNIYNQDAINLKHNTKLAENLMGIKIPSNYIPLLVTKNTNKKDKNTTEESIVMLYNKNGKTILWVSGPLIEKKYQKETLINNFRQFIQSPEEHALIKSNIDIIPEGILRVKNKDYEKYRFNMFTNGYESSGMAVFFNYPDRTVLFIYLSSIKKYNLQDAINILERMNLPE